MPHVKCQKMVKIRINLFFNSRLLFNESVNLLSKRAGIGPHPHVAVNVKGSDFLHSNLLRLLPSCSDDYSFHYKKNQHILTNEKLSRAANLHVYVVSYVWISCLFK